ncbi:MAG: VWA domain-containing protein [Terriglobia bacterium]
MSPRAPVRWAAPLLVGAVLLAASLSGAQERPPDEYRLRVDVRRVVVPASVSTPDGRPVTTLERDAFEIYEDGQRRPLKLFKRSTDLPLQLVLLLDASLSAAIELEREKESMARFIGRVLRPQDAATLYEFSGGVKPLAEFTGDPKKLAVSLKKIRASAGTALYDAVVDASAKLREREGRRVIVLITDGNDTTSKRDFHDALRAAQEAEVTIFALVTRPIQGESGRSVRGEHVLIQFGDLTGGQVFFPSDVSQLDRFFDELSELLRTQYLLAYEPAPAGPQAEFREIEVRVIGGDYIVHFRKGYFAGAQ